MTDIWPGILLGICILVAIGFFAVGWCARGQENRTYGENRLRYLAAEAVEDRTTTVAAERVPPTIHPAVAPVVNLYLTNQPTAVPHYPLGAVLNGQPLPLEPPR